MYTHLQQSCILCSSVKDIAVLYTKCRFLAAEGGSRRIFSPFRCALQCL